MGYLIKVLHKQGDGFHHDGYLHKGRVVLGVSRATYYPHPSAAKKAVRGWLRRPRLGTWRVEVWSCHEVPKLIEITETTQPGPLMRYTYNCGFRRKLGRRWQHKNMQNLTLLSRAEWDHPVLRNILRGMGPPATDGWQLVGYCLTCSEEVDT